jgi:hypothetical protein
MLALGLIAATFAGCGGYDKTTPGTDVEVSGSVNGPDGKPLKDCMIYFQPTGGLAQPAQFPIKDGKFSGKMLTGTYTYYINAPQTGDVKKGEAAIKGLPEAWKAGSLDRQVVVKGGEITLKF